MVSTVLTPSRKPAKPPAAGRHTPKAHAPWFGGEGEGLTLHRYLDDQFVSRFTQDALAGRLTGTRAQVWYRDDCVGRFKDYPLLRLPMHRAFYTVCCEVSCETFGLPAFDPRKIRSAGFVVRRGLPGGRVQRWMLHDGEALGWQDGDGNNLEPDEYRRYVNRGLLQPRVPEPPYSGEETSPLHPLAAPQRTTNGQSRNHTLLWGYLPLGGSHRISGDIEIPADVDAALAQEIAWPCGARGARPWQETDSRPALDGFATPALFDLLGVLLRYGITNASNPDNEALRKLLAEIRFYGPPQHKPLLPYRRFGNPDWAHPGATLLEWLDTSSEAIQAWLTAIDAGTAPLAGTHLPWQVGRDANGQPLTVPITADIYLTREQATLLRQLVPARGRRAMARNDDGIAMPRFPQGEDDIFHAVPFIRWQDDCGCERTTWGAPSLPFRVASPLDPDFQRPQAIILPRLDDLKRGAARGVALLAPKSLANVLRRVSPKMPPGDSGPGNRCGLCWMFSLSIPVVTICALIILMILINLLNLLFGWLPWAILALPRLCGKLLKD